MAGSATDRLIKIVEWLKAGNPSMNEVNVRLEAIEIYLNELADGQPVPELDRTEEN